MEDMDIAEELSDRDIELIEMVFNGIYKPFGRWNRKLKYFSKGDAIESIWAKVLSEELKF